MTRQRHKYDLFISHASEDKAAFAEPLAVALRRWGLRVWFDKFSLTVGDSLRDSIEMGLANSRYGVVIFSPRFLAKKWPRVELNGLFARQMQGKKTILPILHEITIAEMIKVMPIQADGVALKSSDGVEPVARSLVEVIRPSLLKLEVKKDIAFEATDSFIEVAKAQNPGYDFTVHSGGLDLPTRAGTVATVRTNAHRIDVRVSNPALIKEPPTLKIGFKGEGAFKMLDLYRTGRQQSWESGEFKYLGGSLPLMPPFAQDGGKLIMGPGRAGIPPKPIRLEFGSLNPLTLPLMEMRPMRSGTEELELMISHHSSPLTIALVCPLGERRNIECNFSARLIGKSFTQCEKAIKALDRLKAGDTMRLIDIETEKVLMQGPCSLEPLNEEVYPAGLRLLISLVSQIEAHFSCRLDFPEAISDEEEEILGILDSLLNNRPYWNGITATATIEKGEGDSAMTQRQIIAGLPVMLFQEPASFPGHFNLFGKRIPLPAWGFYTEKLSSRGSEADLSTFDRASPGDELEVKFEAETPTIVRWKHSIESPGRR